MLHFTNYAVEIFSKWFSLNSILNYFYKNIKVFFQKALTAAYKLYILNAI